MATQKLHLTDSLLLEFDARVAAISAFGGAPSIVLDRTAFYGEAGGQLGDRGVLRAGDRSILVRDVQVDDDGVVHHLIDGAVDVAPQSEIHGSVELRHRRDSMSQHTGQHMLSRAFYDAAGYATVSARLGSEYSTIDLETALLDRDLVAKVAQRVNDVVLEDRPINVLFPTSEELAALKLRKAPTVTKDIRVIVVEGFDATPCGGTHCHRTGQVGPVIVTGWEKYKGLTRVSFLAGQRSIDHFLKTDALMRSATAALTCTPNEMGTAIARMKEEAKNRTEALGLARAELARFVAADLLAKHPVNPGGPTWIIAERKGEDIAALRIFASALSQRPDVVAVVSSVARDSGDRIVVVDRGSASGFDSGKWVKSVTSASGGRGGGRPEHAEGRVPSSANWAEICRTASQASP